LNNKILLLPYIVNLNNIFQNKARLSYHLLLLMSTTYDVIMQFMFSQIIGSYILC